MELSGVALVLVAILQISLGSKLMAIEKDDSLLKSLVNKLIADSKLTGFVVYNSIIT